MPHLKGELLLRPFLIPLFIFTMFTISCVSQDAGGLRRSSSLQDSAAGDLNDGVGGAGKKANADGDGESTSSEGNVLSSTELRHIVDPFDGTYKTKVTIPKNFTGLLFLSGLNITSLSNRLISVRFRFGRDLEPVTIDAVVGRAPGLTPQTDTEVLILDMNDRPFDNLKLLYDLFDYNDYRDDANPLIETKDPTDDPRNIRLYCRGLKLEHDPTFVPGNNNSRCDGGCPFSNNQCNGGNSCSGNGTPNGVVTGDVANIFFLDVAANKCYKNTGGVNWQEETPDEKCLYAYAKIKDKGLIQGDGVAFNPRLPQSDISGGGYSTDSQEQQLLKCLPGILDDNVPANSVGHLESVLNATPSGAGALIFGSVVTMPDTTTYIYEGPFRTIDENAWELSSKAVFSDIALGATPRGIFQRTLKPNSAQSGNGGYHSFLFPRSGKMQLQSGITHFSAVAPFDAIQGQNTLPSDGETAFMGGCNIRVSEYDSFSNEGISSCNITAVIEILAKDPDSGETVVVGDPSKELKLQLIRPSLINFEGKEVLFTSMKTCETRNTCGGDECCYNRRCWSKTLVSQCKEDAVIVGNGGIGSSCNSDYACSSLCCSEGSGVCDVHINTSTEKRLCSKAPGQRCVAEEFCRLEQVPTCQVTKTGLSSQGKQLCALRCFNIPTHGSCVNGFCQLPTFPDPEAFDADNPDCTNAKDPPILDLSP